MAANMVKLYVGVIDVYLLLLPGTMHGSEKKYLQSNDVTLWDHEHTYDVTLWDNEHLYDVILGTMNSNMVSVNIKGAAHLVTHDKVHLYTI